ncbi:MAG TPA: RagB/SusD family nutrient uptake outer membrane protein [Puia sp.]|jgi:hypothetical protein|nr:RagB/SusD family nutrient uptake outer membrane protein [Puia sp.]
MDGKLIGKLKKDLQPIALIFFIALSNICCNKLVQVPEPISSVTLSQVFSSDATATSAVLGIYNNMSITNGFFNLSITTHAGESADELADQTSGNELNDIFLSNTLTTFNANNFSLQYLWQPAYYDIYCANSVIAGVEASTGMTTNTKIQLAGEAKFIRALCYFYLANLFGDLPLVLSDDFNQTVLLKKSPSTQLYQQIINDLLDAERTLPGDFALTGGQPIRANRWAAAALLAKVYLYQENWSGADSAATAVINSGQFSLVPLPVVPLDGFPLGSPLSDSDAFEANSPEAILQLQSSTQVYPYTTLEGNFFIVFNSNNTPKMWVTSQLLGAFEPNDLRRLNWLDSAGLGQPGGPYYYPYKYKVQTGNPPPILENITLLRFAEQYLIRAEAEANLNHLGAAINDLNTIRTRAGLDSIRLPISQDSVLARVRQENRIEFFAELGHRWLDLKRWGLAIDTLRNISYKRGIDSTQLLYPIPTIELQDDPNLTQNPGYQSY